MKETREAISVVANDDGALAELCLTERHGDEAPWCETLHVGDCPSDGLCARQWSTSGQRTQSCMRRSAAPLSRP